MRLSDDAQESAVLMGFMHLAYHVQHPEFDGVAHRPRGSHNSCEFCRRGERFARGTNRV